MRNAVLWTTVGMSSETGKVTSSDGQLTVTGSPRIARKTGERRRPAAERTRRVAL